MTKRIIEPLESEIKKSIKAYLKKKGIFCYSNITTGIPDKKGNFITHPNAGISDLTAILPCGIYAGIEVKRPSKRKNLTEKQKVFLALVKSRAIGFVATCTKDIDHYMLWCYNCKVNFLCRTKEMQSGKKEGFEKPSP